MTRCFSPSTDYLASATLVHVIRETTTPKHRPVKKKAALGALDR